MSTPPSNPRFGRQNNLKAKDIRRDDRVKGTPLGVSGGFPRANATEFD